MSNNEYVIATLLEIKVAPETAHETVKHERMLMLIVISEDLRKVYCARSDSIARFFPYITNAALLSPEKFSVAHSATGASLQWSNYEFQLAQVDERDDVLRAFLAHSLRDYLRIIAQSASDPEFPIQFGERVLATAQAARDILARWSMHE